MTLAELLIAAAITGSSCCASLQVWSQAGQAARAAQALTQASEQLDRHWLASRRWLTADPQICALDPSTWSMPLQLPEPAHQDLQQSLQPSDSGSGFWLVLREPASGLERRQLFTVAGLGGCRGTGNTAEEEAP